MESEVLFFLPSFVCVSLFIILIDICWAVVFSSEKFIAAFGSDILHIRPQNIWLNGQQLWSKKNPLSFLKC